jgi:hypothetical protein
MVVEETDMGLTTLMVITCQVLLIWVEDNLPVMDRGTTVTDTNHMLLGVLEAMVLCTVVGVQEAEKAW